MRIMGTFKNGSFLTSVEVEDNYNFKNIYIKRKKQKQRKQHGN
jgi:hypothetical protein